MITTLWADESFPSWTWKVFSGCSAECPLGGALDIGNLKPSPKLFKIFILNTYIAKIKPMKENAHKLQLYSSGVCDYLSYKTAIFVASCEY